MAAEGTRRPLTRRTVKEPKEKMRMLTRGTVEEQIGEKNHEGEERSEGGNRMGTMRTTLTQRTVQDQEPKEKMRGEDHEGDEGNDGWNLRGTRRPLTRLTVQEPKEKMSR
jgi:hypothetical protein